ncbi:hypothetical protein OJ996_25915 [Luteolibacter sp. GHJ8]|uniref:SHOCT domain-containing protein n=1 Tax=Luteolibacter rhizosphaerae TaxID=2989719 RepID=A0ABT3GB33_9BACT|nr:hypothetical protein [Luteolibacter rhizosphaerae]MCW1917053.1 hypothetical protein [Luteolibacter rhizosphaerae]
MNQLTESGRNLARRLQDEHGIEHETTISMIKAVQAGNGTMAQFSTRELGYGQWMRGGMTMVSDMFNNALKTKVATICEQISGAMGRGETLFERLEPDDRITSGQEWWPTNLGKPGSSGSQNEMAYAVFPSARRLAVRIGSDVSVYDTGDHQITGVGQQQGASQTVTFTSQLGRLSVDDLKQVRP